MAQRIFRLQLNTEVGLNQPKTVIEVVDKTGSEYTCQSLAEAVKAAEGGATGFYTIPGLVNEVEQIRASTVVGITGPA